MPRILVVDDEPNIIDLTKLYLEREGYRVEGVSNGQDAVTRQAETNPDLVLLDLMLPDIDGFEVCRRIRAKSRVPILMLTAREIVLAHGEISRCKARRARAPSSS